MGDDGGRAPGDVQALLAQRKTAAACKPGGNGDSMWETEPEPGGVWEESVTGTHCPAGPQRGTVVRLWTSEPSASGGWACLGLPRRQCWMGAWAGMEEVPSMGSRREHHCAVPATCSLLTGG